MARDDDDFMADINVTPLVDVMLVLLIIFMVATPMMTAGLDVALPQTEAAQEQSMDSESLTLTIKADGKLFINESETTRADVADALRQALAASGGTCKLFVKADKDVSYAAVVEVLGHVHMAGVNDVNLLALAGPGQQGRERP